MARKLSPEAKKKRMVIAIGGIFIGLAIGAFVLVYKASQQAVESSPAETQQAVDAPAASEPSRNELSAENREKVAAASVRLIGTFNGRAVDGGGYFCHTGLVVTDLAVLGEYDGQTPIAALEVVLYAGVAGKERKLPAHITGIDPYARLAFVKVKGDALPEALAFGDTNKVHADDVVFIPVHATEGGATKTAMVQGTVDKIDFRQSGTRLFTIQADLPQNSGGLPVVLPDGKLLSLTISHRKPGPSWTTAPNEDLAFSVSGYVVDVALKTRNADGDNYTFDITATVMDPAELAQSVVLYYWTASQGGGNPSGHSTAVLTRAGSGAEWKGSLAGITLQRTMQFWAQPSLKTVDGREVAAAAYDRAAELGVPGAAPVAAAPPPQPVYSQPQVTYVQNAPQQVQQITVQRTVQPPPPPPDSPGWTFGYKADPTTGHASGSYENAPKESVRPVITNVTPPPAYNQQAIRENTNEAAMKTLNPYLVLTFGIGIGVCVAMLAPNPFARPKNVDEDAEERSVAEAKSKLAKAIEATKNAPAPAAKPAAPVPAPAAPVAVTPPPAPTALPAEKPQVERPLAAAPKVDKADKGSATKEDTGLDAHLKERIAAAAVFVRATHGGNNYQSCGAFCGSGLIVVNARVLGISRNLRDLPADFSATAYSGALAEPGKTVRIKAYDPDAGLIYLRANTWSVSPLALSDDSVLHAQMTVYYPRFKVSGSTIGVAPLGAGEIITAQLDPATSRLACVSVGADIDGGSAGTPFVDGDGRLVALAGINADDTSSCQTVTCSDLRRSLKGRIGATLIRKTGEKPGDKYSFEIAVESIDPADHIRNLNFYYWTVKAGADGHANSGNMIRQPMTHDEATGRWTTAVFDLAMPAGSKLFMQTGYTGVEREEALSEPLDCAIQLGVPTAPVAPPPETVVAANDLGTAGSSGRQLNAPRVENVPAGGPTNSYFVGTQTQTYSETTYIVTTNGGFTRVEYVVNVGPPPPPPDSPGWNLGYRTDPTSGHPTGDYERADRGYRSNYYDYGNPYPYYPNYNYNNYSNNNYVRNAYSPYVLRH